jgi:hypothetical protein
MIMSAKIYSRIFFVSCCLLNIERALFILIETTLICLHQVYAMLLIKYSLKVVKIHIDLDTD